MVKVPLITPLPLPSIVNLVVSPVFNLRYDAFNSIGTFVVPTSLKAFNLIPLESAVPV